MLRAKGPGVRRRSLEGRRSGKVRLGRLVLWSWKRGFCSVRFAIEIGSGGGLWRRVGKGRLLLVGSLAVGG